MIASLFLQQKGSVTEVVVTPPRAQIGLRRSKKSEHLRPFVYRAVDFWSI